MPWPSMKATMSSLTALRSSGVGAIRNPAKAALYAVLEEGASAVRYVTLLIHSKLTFGATFDPHMLFSKEYVGYLAREVTKKLIAGKFIETDAVPAVTARVNAALVDELTLEDR